MPRKLKNSLPGHECATVPEAGLAGKKNGQLLSFAESDGFDVFLTLDKGIEYRQDLTKRKISIIVVRAKSNRLRDVQPFAPERLAQMRNIAPGQLVRVGQILRSMIVALTRRYGWPLACLSEASPLVRMAPPIINGIDGGESRGFIAFQKGFSIARARSMPPQRRSIISRSEDQRTATIRFANPTPYFHAR
jgi:hypothetical protein